MYNFQQDIKYITPTLEQCNQNNMKNNIVYKTGFFDLQRISLMNCNTKINFHHLIFSLPFFLFWTKCQMAQLVKDETSAKRHKRYPQSLYC